MDMKQAMIERHMVRKFTDKPIRKAQTAWHKRRNFLRDAGRWVSVLSPTISAYLSLASGAILLLFSSLPPAKASMQAVARFLPVEACYLGTALCALAGCVLVFLPYGLIRRQLRSWRG